MKQIRRKGIVSRIVYSRPFMTIVGLFVLTLVSIPLVKNVTQRYKINKEISGLEKEIAEAEAKNQDLNKLVSYLNSEKFVEEKARLDLGLKKPGEEVVVISNESNKENITAAVDQEKSAKTNLQRWRNYFLN